ncbi:hypothetical protein GCM10020358_21230 [Amorphoplanes nipponensis]
MPQRVPQPGGELERQVAVRQAQITAASSTGVGNSSAASPPTRKLGRDPQAVGALGGHRVEAGEQAPAERDLRVHVQLGGFDRERAERAQARLRVLAAAGDGRLDPRHLGAAGAQLGDDRGQGADRGVVDDADHEPARGEIEVDQGRGYEQRADQLRIPRFAVFGVPGQRLGGPEDARRQQGRVIDESCEQRRHQR